MNVVMLTPKLEDCQRELPGPEDQVGQAIAALTSAADTLKNLALVPEHRERMANQTDFEVVRHAMTQTQLVATLIEVRMMANAEIG